MFRILSVKEVNELQRKCFGVAFPHTFEAVEMNGVSYLISVNNKLWRVEEGSLLNPTEQEHNQIAASINVLKVKKILTNVVNSGLLHEVLTSLVIEHPEIVSYLEEAQGEWIK